MILVTGGAGFIGYHLISALSLEHVVISIDSFSDYYSPELKQLRVKNLKTSTDVSVTQLDMRNHNELLHYMQKFNIETVIHLAAQPGVRLPANRFSNYVDSNIVAFENLLQACVQFDVKNVIFASSSSVYGNHAKIPLSENEVMLRPQSYYGATKLSNEITARVIAERYGMKIFGLRFFTVYGPWGRPDMAYTRVISSLINDDEFELFGDGSVVRDFTFVADVVESIKQLSKLLPKQIEGSFDIFNIGGGKPISLKRMIEVCESQLGRLLKTVIKSSNPNDVRETNADWLKLEGYCGNIPKTTLADGLRMTIDWALEPEIKLNLRKWIHSVL